jgi:hypothetical protein
LKIQEKEKERRERREVKEERLKAGVTMRVRMVILMLFRSLNSFARRNLLPLLLLLFPCPLIFPRNLHRLSLPFQLLNFSSEGMSLKVKRTWRKMLK